MPESPQALPASSEVRIKDTPPGWPLAAVLAWIRGHDPEPVAALSQEHSAVGRMAILLTAGLRIEHVENGEVRVENAGRIKKLYEELLAAIEQGDIHGSGRLRDGEGRVPMAVDDFRNTDDDELFIWLLEERIGPYRDVVFSRDAVVQRWPAVSYHTGRPGRPPRMNLVEAEFRRRVEAGELPPSMAAMARELAAWFRDNHPDVEPLTPKTIRNNLSEEFSLAKQAAARK